MGDYHTTRNGRGKVTSVCKLGTMDDWRYVRRREAELIAPHDSGAETDLKVALAEASILYRFPFPGEDLPEDYARIVAAVAERDMFTTYLVSMPDELMPGVVDHGTACVSWGDQGPGKRGAGNLNVIVPCPWSEAFAALKLQCSNPPMGGGTLYGERYHPTAGARTIFRCLYCEAPFSLDPGQLAVVQDLNRERFGERWVDRFQARRE